MDNEGVAFGDIFEIISEGNTTIINYPFVRQHDKRVLAKLKYHIVMKKS